jgi:hypothetical protein
MTNPSGITNISYLETNIEVDAETLGFPQALTWE